MEQFTNFENFDLLNYIFSDENALPVLPAEDTEPEQPVVIFDSELKNFTILNKL
jgi:hypothetical protein